MKKVYAVLFCSFFTLAFLPVKAQTTYVVTAANFLFTPNNLSATVGDTIRFTYLSGFNHTTTSSSVPAGAAAWDNPLTPTALVYNYVITAPGTYNYICKPHVGAGMIGSFVASVVLPIKMTNLKAAAVTASTVSISWKTETEVNADYFSIEMSYDGLNFSEAGVINATGNSTAEIAYAFTVALPAASLNRQYVYFRIKTVDKNSKQQYSDIILCKLQGNAGDSKFITKIFPVPAVNGDHLYIHFNADAAGSMLVTILDVTGRTVSTIPLAAAAGFNQTHMPLPSLKRGTYYLRFDLNGKKDFQPLVIQ